MRIIVTGAAGFIGSHLCEQLLSTGEHSVIGVDALIRDELQRIGTLNMKNFLNHPNFTMITANLLTIDWHALLQDADIVYHLAGIPGVRSSWGTDFRHYVDSNILATQQLLEACRHSSIQKFIFASTSSVYGETTGKVSEHAQTAPLAPYGVSKLTGEHLCRVYGLSYHVPIVVLRFFTVYGPRQRSDMAFHRFIKQMLTDAPITLIGDGTQSRDFTYVSDCVEAIAAVMNAPHLIGETINIGGKERATVIEVIRMLEALTHKKAKIIQSGMMHGEPMHTWADISKANRLLQYKPKIALIDGLSKELDYFRNFY